MKKIVYLGVIILAGLFQVTLLDSFRVFNVKPDLLLTSAIFAGLIFEMRAALALGVIAGILKDTLSANSFGINTLLFPAWIFLIIKLAREIPLDNNLIRAAVASCIVIFHNIASRILVFVLGKSTAFLPLILWVIVLETFYTAAIFPLIFKIIKSIPYSIEIER